MHGGSVGLKCAIKPLDAVRASRSCAAQQHALRGFRVAAATRAPRAAQRQHASSVADAVEPQLSRAAGGAIDTASSSSSSSRSSSSSSSNHDTTNSSSTNSSKTSSTVAAAAGCSPSTDAAAAAGSASAAAGVPTAAAKPTAALGRRRLLTLVAAAASAAAAAAAPQLACPPPASAEAALVVGPPGAPGARYATIGDAVADAPAGATITVLPGRYTERIVVDGKFLTIQASAAKEVVEVVWESQRPYEHTLEVKATGGAVTVRGLTLRHFSKSIANNYCVFAKAGSSLVLDSCDISSNSGVGAGVEGATLQLRDCAVHDCERHGVAAYGGFEGAPGRALLMGCRISGNKLSGVLVRDGGSAVLRENTVERNGEYGVALLDGCTARLFDNRVALNGAGSVQIDVGSVAVDVAEVAARNALDQPAAEQNTHSDALASSFFRQKMAQQQQEEDRSQLRDEIAQEKFDRPFEALDPDEKMSVGGTIGGRRGGEVRKAQMAGGNASDEAKVHEAYSEMGKKGAKKGGYSTGTAHHPQTPRAGGVDGAAPEPAGAVATADTAARDTGGREPDVV